MRKSIILFGLLSICSSCNHLFYQPDQALYYHPSSLGLAYRDYGIQNKAGMSLRILELYPKVGLKEKGTVLHFHGNAQNRTAHLSYTYWLTQRGYRVLIPDYRGYGESQGSPTRAGVLEDGKLFLDHACQVSQGPVFLLGQSLGGAVALSTVLQKPVSCLTALIIDSSFASYRGIARDRLGSFWLTWAFQYPLSFLITDDLSPLPYLKTIILPTLVIHGVEDPVVPPIFGQEIYDRLGSPKKDLWLLPGLGHTEALMHPQYQDGLIQWIDQL
jgi:fermentation-respiration switch protein FrsA (DUF1100 family)